MSEHQFLIGLVTGALIVLVIDTTLVLRDWILEMRSAKRALAAAVRDAAAWEKAGKL